MYMLKKLPSSFTILFLFLILIAGLSWIMPAGQYEMVLNSSLAKPALIPLPGTYHAVVGHQLGLSDLLMAPVAGFYNPATGQIGAINIALFILFMGGFLGVVNATGVIDKAIKQLMHKLGSHQAWIIPILMFTFATAGSLYGMAEETLPFYIILIPIMLAAGYDTVTAVIMLGSFVGNIGSTINPFSTIIAANVSKISLFEGLSRRIVILLLGMLISIIYTMLYAKRIKATPSKSLVFALPIDYQQSFITSATLSLSAALKFKDWLVLGNFKSWWMEQMSALVLFQAIVTAFLCRMSEHDLINNFINGAKDLLGVALIIGLANSIIVLMNDASLTYTFLHWSEILLKDMPKLGFIYAIFFIQAGLSIFIPSSSALAVLTMPVMAPLANFSAVPTDLVITAYQAANGLVNLINPVCAVTVGSLILAKVPFITWLKFIWPLVVLLTIMILVCLSF
jgi:uncharacterized ion transporter superfamily protein YfcC